MSAEIRCFVIGPIGDKDAEVGTDNRRRYEDALQVYERVIKPACTQLGLNPSRADVFIAWLTYLEYRRHTRKVATPA